jgi:hypothetical protein
MLQTASVLGKMVVRMMNVFVQVQQHVSLMACVCVVLINLILEILHQDVVMIKVMAVLTVRVSALA